MQMVETLERPREGPPVPDVLYHGTSLDNWESIQQDRAMYASDHNDDPAVSFTTDWHTAARFARMAAKGAGDRAGVIISFRGDELARKFNLQPFADTGLIHSESEWRVPVSEITQITKYIAGAEEISL